MDSAGALRMFKVDTEGAGWEVVGRSYYQIQRVILMRSINPKAKPKTEGRKRNQVKRKED